jgi:AcrR family transcriptional regulator
MISKPNHLGERIIVEAARLFSEHGVETTSMRMIAESVGVSKAALYYHFDSKEDLHFHIHFAVISEVLEQLREIRDADLSPREKVRNVIGLIFESIATHRDRFTVLLREGARLDGDHWRTLSEKRREFRLLVQEILVDGTERGDFALDHPAVATLALLGMCNWSYTWLDRKGPLSPQELADEFAAIFLEGVTSSPRRLEEVNSGGSVRGTH